MAIHVDKEKCVGCGSCVPACLYNLIEIIDGKAIAEQIRREVGEGVAELLAAGKPRPGLATVLVGERPDSAQYVRTKQKTCAELGMESFGHHLEATATQEEVESLASRRISTRECRPSR